LSKKTFEQKLQAKIEDGTPEEILELFSYFLDDVGVNTQFIQNDDGLIIGQVVIFRCDDKVIVSEPQELEWPLQPLPMPDAMKGNLN